MNLSNFHIAPETVVARFFTLNKHTVACSLWEFTFENISTGYNFFPQLILTMVCSQSDDTIIEQTREQIVLDTIMAVLLWRQVWSFPLLLTRRRCWLKVNLDIVAGWFHSLISLCQHNPMCATLRPLIVRNVKLENIPFIYSFKF